MTHPAQHLVDSLLHAHATAVTGAIARLAGVPDIGHLIRPPVDVSRLTRPVITLPALPKISLPTR